MVFGTTTCKVEPDTTPEQAYERTLGPVPDDYHATTCCGTPNCVRHITIRRTSPGRFDLPPEFAPRPSTNPAREPKSDDLRLKIAQASYARGVNTFKSDAATWQEYVEDYLTSPYTTKLQKTMFCARHRLARGLPCLCGYVHRHRPHKELPTRIYNGITLAEHVEMFPHLDCGKAIVGCPPNERYYEQAQIQNAPEDEDAEAAAHREIAAAFRPIRVIQGEFFRPWR